MPIFHHKVKVDKPTDDPAAQQTRISLSRFDELAGPARNHLSEFQLHVFKCGLEYQMPSNEGLTAIMRGTQRMPDAALSGSLTLDQELGLGGQLNRAVLDVEFSIDRLLRTGQGVDFQRLLKEVMEVSAEFDKLRKTRTMDTEP